MDKLPPYLCRDCGHAIPHCLCFPGGTKHDDGKPRFDLLSYPFLLGISRVLTFGAHKYAAHNWRGGIVYSRVFSALMRHLWSWWWGEQNDPETGLHHLSHAGCCLMFLAEYEHRNSPTLDDRWRYSNAEAPTPADPPADRRVPLDFSGRPRPD